MQTSTEEVTKQWIYGGTGDYRNNSSSILSMIAMVYYEINITLSINIVESSQNLVRNGYYTVVLSQDL